MTGFCCIHFLSAVPSSSEQEKRAECCYQMSTYLFFWGWFLYLVWIRFSLWTNHKFVLRENIMSCLNDTVIISTNKSKQRRKQSNWISCFQLAGREHALTAEIWHTFTFRYFQNIHNKLWPTWNRILRQTPKWWWWCPAWSWHLLILKGMVPRGTESLIY